MRKYLNKLSTYSMIIGAGIGAYGFYKMYKVKSTLPPGVCPIENNRPIMYVAIGFLIASFILSILHDKIERK